MKTNGGELKETLIYHETHGIPYVDGHVQMIEIKSYREVMEQDSGNIHKDRQRAPEADVPEMVRGVRGIRVQF